MNDQTPYRDHRMTAAQATGDRDAAYRGWDFSRAVDDGPLWLRALVEVTRVRSIIILAIMAGTLSLLWIG